MSVQLEQKLLVHACGIRHAHNGSHDRAERIRDRELAAGPHYLPADHHLNSYSRIAIRWQVCSVCFVHLSAGCAPNHNFQRRLPRKTAVHYECWPCHVPEFNSQQSTELEFFRKYFIDSSADQRFWCALHGSRDCWLSQFLRTSCRGDQSSFFKPI